MNLTKDLNGLMNMAHELARGLELYSEALDEQAQQSETSLALHGPLFSQVEPWICEVQQEMIERIPANTRMGKPRAHSFTEDGWYCCPWTNSLMASWKSVVRNGKTLDQLWPLRESRNAHPAIEWFKGPDVNKTHGHAHGAQWVRINTNWVG